MQCTHKNHKANLVESAEDIAYLMQWDPPKEGKKERQMTLFANLSSNEQKVLNLMRQLDAPLSIDHISYQTQLQGSEIAAALLNLEFVGLVKSLPGKRFTPV
jgi:DNA processing protein